ncbi:MAG: hypothetical protein JRD68_04525 [Deltaproteobacteria bacterium]|nr:hypothetical protein [Deltaproteobacteria bacterium]
MVDSGVATEISRAGKLFARQGKKLLEDDLLRDLLKEYEDSISKTNRTMQDIGIARACASCAASQTESCCFEGAAQWYDRVLLLVNLLMGVDLPSGPGRTGHCRFVGREGCELRARYSYCVNYLCPDINASLGRENVARFLSTAGDELARGWDAEQRVIKLLAGNV